MAQPESIDVYDYLDYRAFLRDYYLSRKRSRGLSYRGFSKRAGLRSPNYLKLVIDGNRNLTEEMARTFARACGLDLDRGAFFVELVNFNQATTNSERNRYYQKLTGHKRYRKAQPLELAHAAYHSRWYVPAIRELATRKDFRDDPAWIARMLVPSISKAEATQALDLLQELGLLTRDADGRLVQSEALVSTGPETRGFHIHNYHRTMMTQAADSLETVGAAQRDISALTLCLGEDGLRRLKERLQRFRRELLELSTLENDPKQVVQLNLQLFPLSKAEVES